MRNDRYWANRAAWNMYHYMDEAEKKAEEISQLYFKASKWLSYRSEDIFEKFKTKHKLSDSEARQLLNTLQDKTSLDELLQVLKNKDSGINKKELIKELEAPAYQARLERLRQLQNQLDLVMKEVYQQEKTFSTNFYTDLANEAYYRSMFEIQQKSGYGFSFNHVSQKQIDSVLNMNWSGAHFSKRIWKNTGGLTKALKEELLISLVTGRTERETAQIIAEKFSQGAMAVRRLIRTESNFVSGELNFLAYEEAGIEKYKFLATLDLRTSKICRSLDGKIFLVSERCPGKNCNPMHPWCRSTTVSFISEEVLENMKRRAYNPETRRTELVPASMTYGEWYDKYVKGRTVAEVQEKMIKNRSSDKKQYEQYKKILGDEIPDSFAKFQDMKYNKIEKWNKLKEKVALLRKSKNTGAFAELPERMTKKHIREVADKFGVDTKGLSITIDANEELLKLPFAGRADPEKIGGITFFPNAFRSEEELLRTLFHERQHVLQFKEYGTDYVQNNRMHFEQQAYSAENEFIERLKKEGRL